MKMRLCIIGCNSFNLPPGGTMSSTSDQTSEKEIKNNTTTIALSPLKAKFSGIRFNHSGYQSGLHKPNLLSKKNQFYKLALRPGTFGVFMRNNPVNRPLYFMLKQEPANFPVYNRPGKYFPDSKFDNMKEYSIQVNPDARQLQKCLIQAQTECISATEPHRSGLINTLVNR